jgi:hypothetical protein
MRRAIGLAALAGLVAVAPLGVAHGAADGRAAAGAGGAPARQWTQVTDGTDTRNIDEVGLVRTEDGVLHVLWRDRPGRGEEDIRHTPVSPDGEVGEAVTASGPVSSAGNPVAIVTADGGLRLFYAGLTGSESDLDGVLSASADESGDVWTTDPTRVSSTTSAIPDGVGAAVAPDGTPAFVYAYSFVLGYHLGLDPAVPDVDVVPGNACCAYLPNLAFNDSEGIAAWYSNVEGQVGYYVQTVYPELGSPVAAPERASTAAEGSVAPNQRMALVTRTGTDEIYLAYCSGYPSCTEVLVWQVGSDGPVIVAEGQDVEKVALATDPDGRLWVLWQDVTAGSLMASRSNEDATEFGAPAEFEPADGTESVWHLAGDATDAHLDVVASLTTAAGIDAWHTSVLPGLGVETAPTKKGVTFTVTDAGEPVKGAKVAFRKQSVTTNARGVARAPVGKGTARVRAAGYTAASVTVE